MSPRKQLFRKIISTFFIVLCLMGGIYYFIDSNKNREVPFINSTHIEEIDPNNVRISFDNPPPNNIYTSGCVSSLYAKNKEGVDVAVYVGILTFSWGEKVTNTAPASRS